MLPQPPDHSPGEKELTKNTLHFKCGIVIQYINTVVIIHLTFRKSNTLLTLTARLAKIHIHHTSVHRVAALYCLAAKSSVLCLAPTASPFCSGSRLSLLLSAGLLNDSTCRCALFSHFRQLPLFFDSVTYSLASRVSTLTSLAIC